MDNKETPTYIKDFISKVAELAREGKRVAIVAHRARRLEASTESLKAQLRKLGRSELEIAQIFGDGKPVKLRRRNK